MGLFRALGKTRPNMLRVRLLLIFACVLALGSFLSPATPASPATLTREAESHLHTLLWVLPDLDGDNQVDVATGESAGRDLKVEIHLTTQSELASITLPQRLFGITLSARDVDHDNDEDLIVSDSSSLQRDQVYLNDGHGHFTWSEHWAQWGLLASLTTSALADPACSSLEQCACQNEQPPIDRSSLGALCSVRERSEPVMAAHSACYALLLDFQLRPRSPPAA